MIATLERLIAKKQAIKQGMMQQLLTGRTRLPGFTDDRGSQTHQENLATRHDRDARPSASLLQPRLGIPYLRPFGHSRMADQP